MIVGGKCQGCDARLDYVLNLGDGCAPEVYPREGGVAYRGGHLCGPCAAAVAVLCETLRRQREATAHLVSEDGARCADCGRPIVIVGGRYRHAVDPEHECFMIADKPGGES